MMTAGQFGAPSLPLTALLLVQILATLALCLSARPLGLWLGVMDRPDGLRKMHGRETPQVGGIAILLPFLLLLPLAGPPALWPVLAAVMLPLALMGLLDDRRPLPAMVRLAVSAGLFGAVLLAVPGLAVQGLTLGPALHLDLPDGPGLLLTLLSLVGLQYAFNMSDGADGVAGGTALIWCLFLLAGSPAGLAGPLALLAAGLGCFLLFNLSGRVFLGDSGAYGLAAGIALLGLAGQGPATAATGPGNLTLLALFLVPVLDCLRLIVTRLARGRSPLSPDRDHLHHHLYRRFGGCRWRTAVACWALVAGPNLVLAWIGGPAGLLLCLGLSLGLYILAVAGPVLLPGPAPARPDEAPALEPR